MVIHPNREVRNLFPATIVRYVVRGYKLWPRCLQHGQTFLLFSGFSSGPVTSLVNLGHSLKGFGKGFLSSCGMKAFFLFELEVLSKKQCLPMILSQHAAKVVLQKTWWRNLVDWLPDPNVYSFESCATGGWHKTRDLPTTVGIAHPSHYFLDSARMKREQLSKWKSDDSNHSCCSLMVLIHRWPQNCRWRKGLGTWFDPPVVF